MQHSKAYIIGYSVLLSILVGGLLAWAATGLKEKQDISIDLDTKRQILGAVMQVGKQDDVLKIYSERIEAIVVDRNGDEQTKDAKGNALEAAKIDISKEYKKDPQSRYYPIFKYKENGVIKAYILPMYGNGLWDKIWGYVALSADLNTISGASFGHKAETPGLGARISDADIQGRYKDKKIYNDKNELVSIKMVKGEGNNITSPNEVDGMSGATLTAKGLNDMLLKYFEHYSGYFNKVKKSAVTQTTELPQVDSLANNDSTKVAVDSTKVNTASQQ